METARAASLTVSIPPLSLLAMSKIPIVVATTAFDTLPPSKDGGAFVAAVTCSIWQHADVIASDFDVVSEPAMIVVASVVGVAAVIAPVPIGTVDGIVPARGFAEEKGNDSASADEAGCSNSLS